MFFMEFLRRYTADYYPRQSVSADNVVYNEMVGNYYRNKQEGGL